MSTERMRTIVAEVERHRYFWTNEYELQDSLEKVLTGLAVSAPLRREHRIAGAGRLDFFLDGVGIEVKVKGALSNVIRQLGAYAKSDEVSGLVLVTSVARHQAVPRTIFDTPVGVASLLGDLL